MALSIGSELTSSEQPDLTACDREPIHIPGSIQPHGVLLVLDRNTLCVLHAAGDVEGRLGIADWLGAPIASFLPESMAASLAATGPSGGRSAFMGQWTAPSGEVLDVSAHPAGQSVIVELEPCSAPGAPAATVLGRLEHAVGSFERAAGLKSLAECAAVEFRRLTGFDRVMVYRFLEDETGVVLAEHRDPTASSFLNHRFPASDIPKQARALYIRNLVRVIPDVGYRPAPLRPARPVTDPLDLSDSALRSVSPIHIQYLENMGVGASASISIVVEGALWGLVACHHATPRLLPYDVRAACRALAGGLARQIKAKQDAEGYRERIRLRSFRDEFDAALARTLSLGSALGDSLPELQRMLGADGIAVLRAGELTLAGACPAEGELRTLLDWLAPQALAQPFATEELPSVFPPADVYRSKASGVVAVTVSPDEPFVLLWSRAEQVEVVNWAGNPHKAVALGPGETLSPRASFEAWSEAVRGRARPWTPAEIDAAAMVRQVLLDDRQRRHLRDLNQRLAGALVDKELLLSQKEVLLREVNHRVQNSLQLVSSFLGLQARASVDAVVRENLGEAQRRLGAVALVHRRLYRADQVEAVDLARYFEELCGEMLASMGPDWSEQLTLDAAPILIPTDKAVTLGLILTELVINANKYAYAGAPGPIAITLEEHGSSLRLVVADQGRGQHEPKQGFGTRMMAALVAQLSGTIDYRDNGPGMRAVLTAPILVRSEGSQVTPRG